MKALKIICDQMGFQVLSWQLPTSCSFRPECNIAASSNPQRHYNRFMRIAIQKRFGLSQIRKFVGTVNIKSIIKSRHTIHFSQSEGPSFELFQNNGQG